MPGSGVHRGTDKANRQPAARRVQRQALFERTQGEVQDGALNGNRREKPAGEWERPASPAGAGALNLLPGFGNFYLASGNGGDGGHYLYGFLNLLTWPISVVWGIPEAAIDAETINERELVYYYTFDESGKEALKAKGLKLTASGRLVPLDEK